MTFATHAWIPAFLVGTTTLFVGCSATVERSVDAAAVGTYALVSVDGASVPARVRHDGASLEVRSGNFTIGSDGTCSTTTVFVAPSGAVVTRTVDARYSCDGARLTMRWKGAGTTVGTIDGSTFTMDNEGMSFVYRR